LRSSYKKLMRRGRYSWYLSGVRSSGPPERGDGGGGSRSWSWHKRTGRSKGDEDQVGCYGLRPKPKAQQKRHLCSSTGPLHTHVPRLPPTRSDARLAGADEGRRRRRAHPGPLSEPCSHQAFRPLPSPPYCYRSSVAHSTMPREADRRWRGRRRQRPFPGVGV
jgi:hypothetical protein